jgi:hypothetical protein
MKSSDYILAPIRRSNGIGTKMFPSRVTYFDAVVFDAVVAAAEICARSA